MTPCPIVNCPNKMPPHAIVCVEHWKLVPMAYQRQVQIRRKQAARAIRASNVVLIIKCWRLYRQACQVAVASVSPKETA